MRKIILVLFIINFINPISVYCLNIPKDLQQEVAIAIKNGKALYDAYLQGPITSENIEKEKSKIKDFCEFKYNAYLVNASIYFIAESPSPNDIVFGRHYKISDGVIITSTKSCLVIPPSVPKDKIVVGSYVTYLLTSTPSEFHVFISLKFKRPIYVRTSRGFWEVESDTIEFIEKGKKNNS